MNLCILFTYICNFKYYLNVLLHIINFTFSYLRVYLLNYKYSNDQIMHACSILFNFKLNHRVLTLGIK